MRFCIISFKNLSKQTLTQVFNTGFGAQTPFCRFSIYFRSKSLFSSNFKEIALSGLFIELPFLALGNRLDKKATLTDCAFRISHGGCLGPGDMEFLLKHFCATFTLALIPCPRSQIRLIKVSYWSENPPSNYSEPE